MTRSRFLLSTAALWLTAACGRTGDLPEPEPLPPDTPPTEDEVRAFLGVDPEIRAFLEAEADEARAAAEADAAAVDATPIDQPVDEPIAPGDFDIPIHLNERVRYWLDFYRDRHREHFATYLARMGRYGPYIRERLRARGMPEDLVYLALIESGFSPVARSHASAVGIWQFIAGTARRHGLEVGTYVDERRDPVRATEAALDYLQKLYDRFGSWYLAVAAYNTGEGRVERILRRYADGRRGDDALFWKISDRLPRETRNYVPKLIAAAILARYPERFGFGDVVAEEPLAFDVVEVPDATDLEVIAEAAGVDTETIEQLNPQFLQGVTPPGRTVEVRVPAGRGRAFAIAYEKIPPSDRVRVLRHTVARGETLSHIARRYGTSVRSIQEINGIRNPHSLRVGQRLIVRVGPGARRSAAAAGQGARSAPADAGGASTAVYVVRAGDSLWSIARRHGVEVDDLRTWNDLGQDGKIVPGQELTIRPRPRVIVYRVKPGDTLWDIARRHGVSARELLEWNGLPRDAVIRPGDRVEVPVGGR